MARHDFRLSVKDGKLIPPDDVTVDREDIVTWASVDGPVTVTFPEGKNPFANGNEFTSDTAGEKTTEALVAAVDPPKKRFFCTIKIGEFQPFRDAVGVDTPGS